MKGYGRFGRVVFRWMEISAPPSWFDESIDYTSPRYQEALAFGRAADITETPVAALGGERADQERHGFLVGKAHDLVDRIAAAPGVDQLADAGRASDRHVLWPNPPGAPGAMWERRRERVFLVGPGHFEQARPVVGDDDTALARQQSRHAEQRGLKVLDAWPLPGGR